VGITAGSREVPGRNTCDRRHTYRTIIIIIIIMQLLFINVQVLTTQMPVTKSAPKHKHNTGTEEIHGK